ncbi:TetR/AcrR family transcriptional regulator [Jeotgalibacillus soli]|uniref:HTH tetR-type domain-containing protein n=1 Tax=Jeotgalibacillus soli TaxID=889306 RepID=A0A0C2W7K5_9BACL|nr:TetR/AcrR family transcriptional regulator [Jeotgalibacillus soli]KIL51993.1 hypothetical protein KP78_03630 [Jeotgalibacillus soli]
MSPGRKKIDKRVTRTKEALKASLVELIGEKDFSSITITEITRRVDFNRGTFYAHYTDKEELLNDIITDMIKGFTNAFRETFKDRDFVDFNQLASSSIKIFDHVSLNEQMYKTMLNPHIMPGFLEQIVGGVKKVIMEECIYHDYDQALDINVYIHSRVYALIGMIMYWLQEDFKYSPRYMSEQLLLLMNYKPKHITIKP